MPAADAKTFCHHIIGQGYNDGKEPVPWKQGYLSRAMDNPSANPVVVLREEFDDWAVLFNPDTAEAVGINPTGVSVWKMLDGRLTMAEIVARVGECYSEVPERAADEVRDFIRNLAEKGFVGYEHRGGPT